MAPAQQISSALEEFAALLGEHVVLDTPDEVTPEHVRHALGFAVGDGYVGLVSGDTGIWGMDKSAGNNLYVWVGRSDTGRYMAGVYRHVPGEPVQDLVLFRDVPQF